MFFDLHHRPGLFVLPNAWDVTSAVMLEHAGFPAIGTTSLGVTAAAGLPDGAGAGRELTLELAGALVPRLTVPLTVDLEGGYSDDGAEVAALAVELVELGVAGVNLEDGQAGGELRPVAEHAQIIGAVAEAAPGLFVNARTDTYWLRTGAPLERLEETKRRAAAYRDAGASGVFVPGLTDLTAIGVLAGAVGLPLNVLWNPGSDLEALAVAGVSRVSTGSALYRYALSAALSAADAARSGEPPPGAAIPYDLVQRTLKALGKPS